MIAIDTKTLFLGGLAALAAVTVGVAIYMVAREASWSEVAAEKAHTDMLDAYNDAIKEFPHDHNKAAFLFEASKTGIYNVFKAQYGEFEEFAAWEAKFNETFKFQKAAMRKV
jgi:hypothetical protein